MSVSQLIQRWKPGSSFRGRLRKLTRKQKLFDELETHVKGFVGGRGVGKTEVGSHWILKHSRPGDPWMVVSPDYNVIQDTTWPTFERVAQQTGQWYRGIKSPTPRAWFRPVGGGPLCQVVFRSAEKPDKLRGGSWAGLWFDEASIMCHDAFTFAIPALRWMGRRGTVLVTMTPKGLNHWTFRLFFEDCDEGEIEILNSGPDAVNLLDDPSRYQHIAGRWYRRCDSTGLVMAHSRENPFLPDTFEHDIGAHLSSALKAQELAGEFILMDGLYYRREWFKFVEEVPRIAQRVRYWDRAASSNSGCFSAGVLMARTDDGLYYIEDVKRGQWSYEHRNAAILEAAREDDIKYGGTVQVWGEQEGGSAGKEISQQFVKMLAGYPAHVDIVTGKGTKLLDGIEVPHKPKIVRSQGLIAQAEAGNVKLKRASWNSELLDEFCAFGQSDIMDQCVAEGTLVETQRGSVPIEQMRQTDFVWTRWGLAPIIDVWCTGDHEQVFMMETSDGRTIEATAGHPFWIDSVGWVCLNSLKQSVGVTVSAKQLSSMESRGLATLSPRVVTIASISARESVARGLCCTGTYGSRCMVHCPTNTRSTTRTATRSTTPLRTWSASRKSSIGEYTPTSGRSALQSSWSISPEFEASRKTGIGRMRDGRGIVSMPRHQSAAASQPGRSAHGAVSSSWVSTWVGGDFVAVNARSENATIGRKKSSQEPASGAEMRFSESDPESSGIAQSLARILTIGPSGRKPVWNLTVNGPPEYFANGILVHNCDAAAGAFNKLCRTWTTDPGWTGRVKIGRDPSKYGIQLDTTEPGTQRRR